MPSYAALKDVFPDKPFSGTTGSYLDRVNPSKTRIEPFENEVRKYNQTSAKNYPTPINKSLLYQPVNPSNPPLNVMNKILATSSPISHSQYVAGKPGGGYRVQQQQTPQGVLEPKTYQSYADAFKITDITENRRLGSPLRHQLLNDKVPNEYKTIPKQDYYSYLTPAMEEQLAMETDRISCHYFYKHLNTCKDCQRNLNNKVHNTIEGFSNDSTSDSNLRKRNRNLEFALIVLLGVFLIIIMNIFLHMKL